MHFPSKMPPEGQCHFFPFIVYIGVGRRRRLYISFGAPFFFSERSFIRDRCVCERGGGYRIRSERSRDEIFFRKALEGFDTLLSGRNKNYILQCLDRLKRIHAHARTNTPPHTHTCVYIVIKIGSIN